MAVSSLRAGDTTKGVSGTRAAGGQQGSPPSIFSPEGMMILVLAALFDLVNIILGILDFLLIGLILSPIWNLITVGTLGVWLWLRTGQGVRSPNLQKNRRFTSFLAKKIVLPFIGNSVPLAKFFPWWLWSVWTSLDKGFSATEEQATQDQPAQATP